MAIFLQGLSILSFKTSISPCLLILFLSIVNIYFVFLEDWLTRSCCPVLQGDFNNRSFFNSPTRKSHVSVSRPTTRLSPRYLHPVLHDQHLLSLSILSFNTDVSPGLSILSFKMINTPVMSNLSLVSHQVCIFCPSKYYLTRSVSPVLQNIISPKR